MRKYTLIYFVLSIFLSSCDSNKDYISKIKDRINSDGSGFDMKYKSLELTFFDTIYIKDIKDSLDFLINKTMMPLLRDSDFIINADTPRRLKVIKDKILEREKRQERLLSYEGSSYYTTPKSTKALISIIDSIINNFSINSSHYFIIKTILNHREKQAYQHSLYDIAGEYHSLESDIDKIEAYQKTRDSLATFYELKIIKIKTLNKYTINNPFFNGAKQTLESVFVFDGNKKLIERIDNNGIDLKGLIK